MQEVPYFVPVSLLFLRMKYRPHDLEANGVQIVIQMVLEVPYFALTLLLMLGMEY